MASKYVAYYTLDGLNQKQFIMLVIEAAQSLQWQVCDLSGPIKLRVPRSAFSYGEIVTLTTDDNLITIESKDVQTRLFGGRKKNEDNLWRIKATLDETRKSYTSEELTEKYDALAAQQEAYAKDLEERKKTNNLTGSEKMTLGIGGRYVTYTLIGLNTLIFLLMVLNGAGFFEFDNNSLFKWGANIRYATANGEWYRLITCVFLHVGIVHLAFNMYALYFVGIFLEPLLGKWRYLAAYVACGICASVTSLAMHENTLSIGASGAIFGLYGVFIALLTTNFIDKATRTPLLQSIGVFVVFNLVYGLKGNVDNAAHVGGLVSGTLFGYIYYFLFLKRKDNVVLSIAITIAMAVAVVFIVLPRFKDNTTRVSQDVDRFIPLQDSAFAALKNIRDSSFSDETAKQLTDISLPIWMGWKQAIDSSADEKVSKDARRQINRLRTYVNLRIRQTQLYIQRERERTYQYDNRLSNIRDSIEGILTLINKK